jgi:hypothetical protein
MEPISLTEHHAAFCSRLTSHFTILKAQCRHVEEQLALVNIHIKSRNAGATVEIMQWAWMHTERNTSNKNLKVIRGNLSCAADLNVMNTTALCTVLHWQSQPNASSSQLFFMISFVIWRLWSKRENIVIEIIYEYRTVLFIRKCKEGSIFWQ